MGSKTQRKRTSQAWQKLRFPRKAVSVFALVFSFAVGAVACAAMAFVLNPEIASCMLVAWMLGQVMLFVVGVPVSDQVEPVSRKRYKRYCV